MRMWEDADFLEYSVRENHPEFAEHCEMTPFEHAFLVGLLAKYRPRKILEVGVSAGSTTAIMLQALLDFSIDAELYSVDVSPMWYRDHEKKTGFLAEKYFINNQNWHLHCGKIIPDIIQEFSTFFDLVLLDTVHLFPGELLDYLCVLPFLNTNSVVVLHDTCLHLDVHAPKMYATGCLSCACVGDMIHVADLESHHSNLPNIYAFKVCDDTKKYVNNTFRLLSMPWEYKLSDAHFMAYKTFYHNTYGEIYGTYFHLAKNANYSLLDKQLQREREEREREREEREREREELNTWRKRAVDLSCSRWRKLGRLLGIVKKTGWGNEL